jgi:hypothetical protein
MNIFVTDKNPYYAAISLDDKRLIKMCLETTQILSTVLNIKHEKKEISYKGPYKSTHKNHPCVKWAEKDHTNFIWAEHYLNELFEEYYLRFNRNHACTKFTHILVYSTTQRLSTTINYDKIEFYNCTNMKSENALKMFSTFDLYKIYLNNKWKNDKRKPKWTNRNPPSWAKI